jgi:hypothetical protein
MYNVASCWLYLKEYINDARYHERQSLKRYALNFFEKPATIYQLTRHNISGSFSLYRYRSKNLVPQRIPSLCYFSMNATLVGY